MTVLLTGLGLLTVLAAAIRSTWSPCGLSMLSTINPVSEAARGHRYRTTAAWFITGAVVGGAMLGAGAAALAGGVTVLHLSPTDRWWAVAAAAVLAVAADVGVAGVEFPLYRRQVNERWLDQYRPWFYGFGFGWQIGVGLATYIMTAAVLLLIVLGALTAAPWLALLFGTCFGLSRGLTVLLGRPLRTPGALRAFHRRFDSAGERVRVAVIAVQGGVALVAVGAASTNTFTLAVTAPISIALLSATSLAVVTIVLVATRLRRRT